MSVCEPMGTSQGWSLRWTRLDRSVMALLSGVLHALCALVADNRIAVNTVVVKNAIAMSPDSLVLATI